MHFDQVYSTLVPPELGIDDVPRKRKVEVVVHHSPDRVRKHGHMRTLESTDLPQRDRVVGKAMCPRVEHIDRPHGRRHCCPDGFGHHLSTTTNVKLAWESFMASENGDQPSHGTSERDKRHLLMKTGAAKTKKHFHVESSFQQSRNGGSEQTRRESPFSSPQKRKFTARNTDNLSPIIAHSYLHSTDQSGSLSIGKKTFKTNSPTNDVKPYWFAESSHAPAGLMWKSPLDDATAAPSRISYASYNQEFSKYPPPEKSTQSGASSNRGNNSPRQLQAGNMSVNAMDDSVILNNQSRREKSLNLSRGMFGSPRSAADHRFSATAPVVFNLSPQPNPSTFSRSPYPSFVDDITTPPRASRQHVDVSPIATSFATPIATAEEAERLRFSTLSFTSPDSKGPTTPTKNKQRVLSGRQTPQSTAPPSRSQSPLSSAHRKFTAPTHSPSSGRMPSSFTPVSKSSRSPTLVGTGPVTVSTPTRARCASPVVVSGNTSPVAIPRLNLSSV